MSSIINNHHLYLDPITESQPNILFMQILELPFIIIAMLPNYAERLVYRRQRLSTLSAIYLIEKQFLNTMKYFLYLKKARLNFTSNWNR